MEAVEGKGPSPAISNDTFWETLHFEENHVDAPGLFTDPSADYWFWDYIVSGDPGMESKTFTLQAKGVSSSAGDAYLAIDLRGATSASVSKEHHAIVTLNGTKIGETSWEGTGDHALTLPFSQGLLKEGDNALNLTGVLDPGVPYSIFFINSFDLTYKRVYQAVNDRLEFRGDENQVVTVAGFTTPDILLFEITDSKTPRFIKATTIDGSDGNFRVSFEPASPEATYLAVSGGGIRVGTDLSGVVPSKLGGKNKGADYLIITTPDFLEASSTLAVYRKNQGLSTMVVNLEDIMDEFNDGIFSPEAIRDFLSDAYQNWKKPPRYVVLAGNGTYDYKNNLGYGDCLIPVMMVSTPDGLFPSDNYFVDINGDHVPEMAIGRLPAVTSEELMDMISKIGAYETAAGGPWEKRILMLADKPDEGGDFPTESNQVASLLSSKYTPIPISLTEHPLDEARSLLLNGISSGAAYLNYIGHAGMDRLSKDGLLMSSDVNLMTNETGFPIVTAMTCVVGQFSIPGYDSLAEELVLRPKGGAVCRLGSQRYFHRCRGRHSR